MRLDTSFAHCTTSDHAVDRPPLRSGHSSGKTSAATTVLESHCGAIVARSLRAGKLPTPAELDPVRRSSDHLVRGGVALRDAQRAVHLAVSAGLRDSIDGVSGGQDADVVGSAVFMMRVLELLGNTVSAAYIEHCKLESGTTGDQASRLVDLLVSDDPEARAVAERHGIDIAAEYDVVFLRFVADAADAERSLGRTIDSAKVAAAELALTSDSVAHGPLLSLSTSGGTILVPSVRSDAVEECIAQLNSVLRVNVVAATARAVPGAIADAVAHCRELVDLARSLRMQPRLYRTGDLALEYQLSRPGPGRSRLRSVIAPLDAFPELMHTLKTFVASEANRRASAKSLYVHPNTVDYRLKRIEQLTGVDPLSSAGLMSLHAALVVDCLSRADAAGTSGPSVSNVVAEAS